MQHGDLSHNEQLAVMADLNSWKTRALAAEARASTLQGDLEAVEAVLNHAGAPTHDGPDQGDSGPIAKLSMAGRVDALAAANERLARLGRAMEAERNSAVDRADALQGEVDGLRERLGRASYVVSEPHLSGHRVSMGFETLEAAQDAHEAVARTRVSQTKGEL